ncbi:MAG: hypothetical protein IJC16_05770 [Rikenellaceae bacterium]|nr:hypothetical protein [Rikenellaceae bacterium]
MRKTILYTVCLLVLTVTGCDRSVLEVPEGGGVDPTLVRMNLSLEVDPSIELYAFPPSKAAGVDETHHVRWIVEVFRDEIGGEPVERRILCCDKAADGKHTIETSIPLHAASYRVVAWADYVDKGSTEDKYYTVSSLSSICIPEPEDYMGDERHKDAYVGRKAFDLTGYLDRWNETAECAMTLERPMAQIEFITTDVDKFLDNLSKRNAKAYGAVAYNLLGSAPDLSSIQVTVDYAGYFPSSFNAYTDKANDACLGMSFGCCMTPLTEKEAHLAGDHIFVNGSESAVTVNLTLRDGEGNLLNRVEGIDVPIVRGKLTVIRDGFLTRSYAPGIGIDPGFDGEIDIVIPD